MPQQDIGVLRVWRGGAGIGGAWDLEIRAGEWRQPQLPVSVADLDGDGSRDLLVKGSGGARNRGSGDVHVLRGPLPAAGVVDLSVSPADMSVFGGPLDGDFVEHAAFDEDDDGLPEIAVVESVAWGGGVSGAIAIISPDFSDPPAVASLHVDPVAGNDTADGLGWATALRTIGAALSRLDTSMAPVEVRVASGRAAERIFLGAGVSLLGGFDPATGARHPTARPTVLDGGGVGPVVFLAGGRGLDQSRLDGFLVTGGRGEEGAAIVIAAAGGLVSNCVIRGNEALGTLASHFYTCWDASNTTSWNTTGCCALPGRGAAVYVEDGSGEWATLRNVLIDGNGGTLAPPDPCAPPTPPPGYTCTFDDCPGPRTVTAIHVGVLGELRLENVTLAGNAGGLFVSDFGSASIQDSILHGNGGWDLASDGTIAVESSLVGTTPLVLAPSNLRTDPLFVDPPADFHLSQLASTQSVQSPAVDAGSALASSACPGPGPGDCFDDLTTRSDGVPDQGAIDLGFHWWPDSPPIFAGVAGARAVGSCAIQVSWGAAVDPDASTTLAYRVFRAAGAASVDFSAPIAVLPEPARDYLDAGLDVSISYRYVVQAEDSPGHVDGNTLEASARPVDIASPWLDDPLPVVVGACDVDVALAVVDDCSGIAGIDLHRSLDPTFTPDATTRIATGVVSPYRDVVPSNGNWWYRAVATDVAGNAAASRSSAARIDACGGALPVPGEAMIARVAWTTPRVTLTIDPAPGADFHRIFRGALFDLAISGYLHGPEVPANCNLAGSVFDDAADASIGSFYYLVAGVNAAGEGLVGRDSFGAITPDAAAFGLGCP